MIDIERLTKVFNVGTVNAVTALRDLSLHLTDGEFVTVVGSNGAGKSSLLHSIAGVHVIEQGRIVIDGHDVTTSAEHQKGPFHWSRVSKSR